MEYRWVCPIDWSSPVIKCQAHFEDIYNDNILYYRGPTLGLPPGYSECVWTTNEGYVSSKNSGPAECGDCYDSGAFGSFGFIPAIRLTLSKDGAEAPCIFNAHMQFSLTVGEGCVATGPTIGYFWRQNLAEQPFLGCMLEYILERFGFFTPDVDATITPQ